MKEGLNRSIPSELPSSPAKVLWLIGTLCLVFVIFITLGAEPSNTVKNTKLFPLFESSKYHLLEKDLDTNQKVLLLGDESDGLGIFVDQYVHERNHLVTIKRRQYRAGRNLDYASDSMFSKGYFFLKNFVNSWWNSGEKQPVLWVIESEDAFNLLDIQGLERFMNRHLADKFLVTAEVAPTKASRVFKIIQFQELPKKYVSELLFKEHKLDRINAQNLLDSFGGDL